MASDIVYTIAESLLFTTEYVSVSIISYCNGIDRSGPFIFLEIIYRTIPFPNRIRSFHCFLTVVRLRGFSFLRTISGWTLNVVLFSIPDIFILSLKVDCPSKVFVNVFVFSSSPGNCVGTYVSQEIRPGEKRAGVRNFFLKPFVGVYH